MCLKTLGSEIESLGRRPVGLEVFENMGIGNRKFRKKRHRIRNV